jgi:hypothetical protein
MNNPERSGRKVFRLFFVVFTKQTINIRFLLLNFHPACFNFYLDSHRLPRKTSPFIPRKDRHYLVVYQFEIVRLSGYQLLAAPDNCKAF